MTSPNVYSQIKKLILSGDMSAGEKLASQQLADRLGLSRTPVREALTRLESEGLVMRHANRGYSVRMLSLRETSHLFEARMVIEVANASFAAQRIQENALVAMQEVLQHAQRLLREKRIGEFQHAARRFHQYVAESAGNTHLLRMFGQINDLVLLFGITLLRASPARAEEIMAENQRIYERIAMRQAVEAATAMQDHIKRGHQHFCQSLVDLTSDLYTMPDFTLGAQL